MPIAKVQLPDGRIARFEVEEGTSPAEIEAFAARQFMAKGDASKQIENDAITKAAKAEQSPMSNFASDINSGLKALNPLTYASKAMNNALGSIDKAAYNTGGRVTDALSGVTSPEVAAGVGTLANVGVQQIPMMLGGAIAKPVGQSVGRSIMQSAIKPTTFDNSSGKGARAIETILKENVSPTVAGIGSLKNQADDLAPRVSGILSQSGEAVSRSNPMSGVSEVRKRFATQADPADDLAAITKVADGFMDVFHPRMGPMQSIPVGLANEIKQGIYQSVGGRNYGARSTAGVEAEKAIARVLKEDIANKVPEVAPMLARQSDLYNAVNVAMRYAANAGNNNPLGLAPLANDQVRALVFLADRNPWIRGVLARGAYHGAEPVGRLAGAGLGAYSGLPE